jgi:hypothetical protein
MTCAGCKVSLRSTQQFTVNKNGMQPLCMPCSPFKGFVPRPRPRFGKSCLNSISRICGSVISIFITDKEMFVCVENSLFQLNRPGIKLRSELQYLSILQCALRTSLGCHTFGVVSKNVAFKLV